MQLGLVSAVIMVLILIVGLSTPSLAQLDPDIYVRPSMHNFGDVPLGITATVYVTIHNVGDGDLTIYSIVFQVGSSPDFSIAFGPSTPAILRPRAEERMYIWYSPSALGTASATLVITSNSPGEELVAIGLHGTGIESEPPGTGIPICTNPYGQSDPAISGSRIVWQDNRNGNLDIYMYDLATQTEIPICTDPGPQYDPVISGNTIVWTSGPHYPYIDIYMYDLTTGLQTLICTDTPDPLPVAISGDRILWNDSRNTNSDIYMYDLAIQTETQITTDPEYQGYPAISGDRIVWQDNRNGNYDIYMYDLASATETPICTHPAYQGPPAISGDHIAWVDHRNWWNIYVYDLTTGTETQITNNTLPGQFPLRPDVSGTRIVWTDSRSGNHDIYMYDVATGTEMPICTAPKGQTEPAISGNRVVWMDFRYGNYNIYVMYLLSPDIDVFPLVYDFGDVELGSSSMTIVTISNVGDDDLTVGDIHFLPDGGDDFSIIVSPGLPVVVVPNGTVDVEIIYTPLALGESSATLEIISDDPDESLVDMALSGAGVEAELPPEEQIAAILAFFDASVADGTLVGSGPGGSADGRRNALRNMIEATGDLIAGGLIDEARDQLIDAYYRTDGEGPPGSPPDFVTGPAADELAGMIWALIESL